MLSWEELERMRQSGELNPNAAPIDAQFGVQPFGLEPAGKQFGTGTMPGDPSTMRPPQSNGYGHQMTFNSMGGGIPAMLKRQKERGNMGIAQPHQAGAATGDMPIGKNSLGHSLSGIFKGMFR